jgi:hypothetical protein
VKPQLDPDLPLLWRDRRTVQIGLHPDRALVIGGVGRAAVATLQRLDGRHDVHRLQLEAAARGGDPGDVDRLLDLLRQADVLVPEAETDPLADAWVLVRGAGRVGCAVAGLLAASGVGTVTVDDPDPVRPADVGVGAAGVADLGRRRDDVASAVVRAQAERSAGAPITRERDTPDLAVLAPAEGLGRRAALDAGLADHPYLLVVATSGLATVGPLVVPGQTSCVRCHDLQRTDRDPQWPQLLGQLEVRRHAAADPLLVMAAAVLAAGEVVGWLRTGTAATSDGTLDLASPLGPVRRRSWTPHPACGCTWDGPGPTGWEVGPA